MVIVLTNMDPPAATEVARFIATRPLIISHISLTTFGLLARSDCDREVSMSGTYRLARGCEADEIIRRIDELGDAA